jgi:hypothetical protein
LFSFLSCNLLSRHRFFVLKKFKFEFII